mmetsp:Transcript_1722/g.2706  ORF Transcript_1722/g.2706 Transcript_1722/m.2706 type:complete len:289 (+) Transcript_1722:375-1241(+)|eukprot:CAMPEP_0184517806 /NCGR_PEP_ID=MMETSP0198_2-20121128/5753_1 /TAXON_ID=1112570 /ORGANISM="Thraustochytrium sp., Strain LLF1b" /LENGTH=288 /DNA_ID=CAMNT_0026908207 /DNA_START=319 /DNA_END=1185 /DNA_ORIENTATION=+
MKYFQFRRRRRSSASTSASNFGDEDSTEPDDRESLSRAIKRRSSKFKPKRTETQNILAEPEHLVEKLMENGMFGSDMVFTPKPEAGPIFKEGKLEKQGNFFKTWHRRYFVLTSNELTYYENKKKFRSHYRPLGVIPFKDIVTEGNQVVHDVSDHLVTVLQLAGKRNLFCVHIENRTYVMSASSRNEKLEWARAITKSYHEAMEKKEAAVRRAKKSIKPKNIFAEVKTESELYDDFDHALTKLRDEFNMRRTFQAWTAYSKYSKSHGLRVAQKFTGFRKTREPSLIVLS